MYMCSQNKSQLLHVDSYRFLIYLENTPESQTPALGGHNTEAPARMRALSRDVIYQSLAVSYRWSVLIYIPTEMFRMIVMLSLMLEGKRSDGI
jgi:hypothetical protein